MTDKEILENLRYYNNKVADVLGVEVKDISFEISNAKELAGSCKVFKYSSEMIIRISRVLAQVRSKEETQNTIVHELCHAYNEDRDGHGYYWKQIAKEVGRALGFEITRNYSLSETQKDSLSSLKSPVGIIEVPELNYKKYVYRKDKGYKAGYKGWGITTNGCRYEVQFTKLRW